MMEETRRIGVTSCPNSVCVELFEPRYIAGVTLTSPLQPHPNFISRPLDSTWWARTWCGAASPRSFASPSTTASSSPATSTPVPTSAPGPPPPSSSSTSSPFPLFPLPSPSLPDAGQGRARRPPQLRPAPQLLRLLRGPLQLPLGARRRCARRRRPAPRRPPRPRRTPPAQPCIASPSAQSGSPIGALASRLISRPSFSFFSHPCRSLSESQPVISLLCLCFLI